VHYLLVVCAKLIENICMQISASRTHGFLLNNAVMELPKLSGTRIEDKCNKCRNQGIRRDIKSYVRFQTTRFLSLPFLIYSVFPSRINYSILQNSRASNLHVHRTFPEVTWIRGKYLSRMIEFYLIEFPGESLSKFLHDLSSVAFLRRHFRVIPPAFLHEPHNRKANCTRPRRKYRSK